MANTIESFIAALKDKNDGVRWNAAEALWRMGKPAVEPLIAALEDVNWSDIRKGSAEALGKIGDPRAVGPLITALEDKNEDVQKRAIEALGKIGDPRAIVPLIAALKDKANNVRSLAVDALKKIGKPAVVPLISALKDEDGDVRQCAAEALEELNWKLLNEIEQINYLVAKKKLDELINIGKPAVEPLITALKDKDLEVRLFAAEALWRMGDPRAVGPLIAVLIAALKDKDDDVREVAAGALGEIGDPRAVGPLIAALRDGNQNVRKAAAEALRNAKLSLYNKIKFLLATVFRKIEIPKKEVVSDTLSPFKLASSSLDLAFFENGTEPTSQCESRAENYLAKYDAKDDSVLLGLAWYAQSCLLGTKNFIPYLILHYAAQDMNLGTLAQGCLNASDVLSASEKRMRNRKIRFSDLWNSSEIKRLLREFERSISRYLPKEHEIPDDPWEREAFFGARYAERDKLFRQLTER